MPVLGRLHRAGPSGRISDSLLRDTCDAEYGVNVFDSGRSTVVGNRTRGFSDAGFYVGGIRSTGSGVLRVARQRHASPTTAG